MIIYIWAKYSHGHGSNYRLKTSHTDKAARKERSCKAGTWETLRLSGPVNSNKQDSVQMDFSAPGPTENCFMCSTRAGAFPHSVSVFSGRAYSSGCLCSPTCLRTGIQIYPFVPVDAWIQQHRRSTEVNKNCPRHAFWARQRASHVSNYFHRSWWNWIPWPESRLTCSHKVFKFNITHNLAWFRPICLLFQIF